jgi:hypothetical protein
VAEASGLMKDDIINVLLVIIIFLFGKCAHQQMCSGPDAASDAECGNSDPSETHTR